MSWSLATLAVLTGCGSSSDPKAVIEAGKVQISGEQVAITPDQVLCGQKEGLWRIEQMGDGARGRLTPEAHALGFSDDVVMGDTHFTDPYAQMTGSQQLAVEKVTTITDDDPSTKTMTGSVSVVIKHSCFDKPLPMHGSDSHGFSQSAELQVRLRNDSGWKVERIVH